MRLALRWRRTLGPRPEGRLPSWRRDRIPSLENTWRRCHSMVRGLRNRRAAISGFESPSLASWAIWRSCGVRSSRVSAIRRRTFSPVARSSPPARSANASMPIDVNSSCARLSSARASSRRLSRRSHSPYSRCVRASSARTRVRPRWSIAVAEPALGVGALAEQGPGARLDAERPFGSRGLCLGGQPLQRVRRQIGPAASRGRLDQLAQAPVLRDDLSMLAGGDRGGQGLLVLGRGRCRGRRARTR